MLSLTNSPTSLGTDAVITAPKLPDSALEFALDFTPHVSLRDLAAAIAALLAAGQRQLDLCPGALEVNPGRDQGQPPLRGLSDQPLDLGSVQKQLARAFGVVVLAAGGLIGRDVQAPQPDLAAVDRRVGVAQLGLSVAQRLHLGSAQRDPRLDLFDQLEAVT